MPQKRKEWVDKSVYSKIYDLELPLGNSGLHARVEIILPIACSDRSESLRKEILSNG